MAALYSSSRNFFSTVIVAFASSATAAFVTFSFSTSIFSFSATWRFSLRCASSFSRIFLRFSSMLRPRYVANRSGRASTLGSSD